LAEVVSYCGAVAVTTLVATLGTYPFSIYHFHHIALYSPLANVIAVPLSALWTLPWGVVTCLLMPFGLERLALIPMGWGIEVTIWVAQHVSILPGNVWTTPRLPPAGLLLIALGGLWLCLWRGSWRRWGVVAIVTGFAGMTLTRPPDVVIADIGRFVAARAPDGHYFVSADKGESMVRSFLAEETGEALADWPEAGIGAEEGLDCQRVLSVQGAWPHRGDHHRRGRAAAQMRRHRRDRQSGAGRLSLPFDDAGHRPDRLVAARCCRAVAQRRRHHRRKHQ
jgi:competence protein ComEC